MDSNQNSPSYWVLSHMGFRKIKILSFLAFTWAMLLIAYVTWVSRGLRPMADDYSHGVALHVGPFAAMLNWWNSWSGDMSSILANVLLVGWPLQTLPWSFGSSIPFLLSGLMVAVTLILILRVNSGLGRKLKAVQLMYVLPVVLITWWSFWWVNKIMAPGDSFFESTATAVTLWQNVNVTYVFIPALNISLWLTIEKFRRRNQHVWWLAFSYILVGAFIGMSGVVFATSFVLFQMMVVIGIWINNGQFQTRTLVLWAIASIAVIVSALGSYFSPGSQLRSTVLPDVSINQVTTLKLMQTLAPALSDWWRSLASPGMLISVLTFLMISTVLAWSKYSIRSRDLRQLGLGLIIFSIVITLINGFSEVFSYPAYWHRIQGTLVLWLGISAITLSFGKEIAGTLSRLASLALICLLVSIVCTAAIFQMTVEISSRYRLWEAGPAPTTYISDIEDEDGWQRAAWIELRSQRGGPDRGL